MSNKSKQTNNTPAAAAAGTDAQGATDGAALNQDMQQDAAGDAAAANAANAAGDGVTSNQVSSNAALEGRAPLQECEACGWVGAKEKCPQDEVDGLLCLACEEPVVDFNE